MSTKITPQTIHLDASTYCQLKCVTCPTAQGKIKDTLGSGFLSLENLQKLIDKNPNILHIELSNWGEIFLNPHLIEIMEYAYQNNITLRASNGANLNNVKKEVIEALVKYKFRYITCSIDGITQETYQQYRIGGNVEGVIDNIKMINHYKKLYNSPYPVLCWQFIAFGHNEHEIQSAKELAESLNMKFWLKLSWEEEFSPIKNKQLVQSYTKSGVTSRSEYEEKYATTYMQKTFCSQLWQNPQINWDGRVLGCCVNSWGDFGNAFESNLDECLNGEKINYARQMLLGKKEKKEGIPCTDCIHYKTMEQTGKWLTVKDVMDFSLMGKLPSSLGKLKTWIINRFSFLSQIFITLMLTKIINKKLD